MAYRWGLEGPAFEFPSPYGVENRFLVLRGYVLIVLAIGIALVLAFVSDDDSLRPVALLDKLPERSGVWPHLVCALLMAVLGSLNLVQASRQRTLLLPPGQPASLMPEVSHEATGASSGAAWLMQAMGRGVALSPELSGPYARWLGRLGPDLAAAPTPLHGYMRVRLARLAFQGGLALLLALGAAGALVLGKPLALPAVALIVYLLGVAAFERHLLYPEQVAPGPPVIAGLLGAALLAALPLAWFVDVLPGVSWWPRLGLPAAAGAMLALGLMFEALGLLAARAQLVAPQGSPAGSESVTVSFGADPGRLIAEVDRELQRRWAEGVPNRRYARQPPLIDPAAEAGDFNATVFEESQPVGQRAARRGAAPAPVAAAEAPWLLLLELLGAASSIVGGLLWAWLALAHMHDSNASWMPATLGLVCLLAGGYVRRIAHVLWSRVEVDSTLIWLDFAGTYFRLPDAAATASPDATGRASAGLPVGVEELTLKACLARVRSVFYAAAPSGAGSRALLTLSGDPVAARHWTALVQTFARTAAPGATADSPAMRAARAKARDHHGGGPRPAAPAWGPARFCSACGAPLLVGGRFCQQCGKALAAGD